MGVTGVKLPPQSNPLIVAYERISNSNARTEELQAEREELRLRFGELRLDCEKHFWKCDEVRIAQLLEEREEITEEAKSLLSEISDWQNTNARHTGAQPRLQANLQRAQERLMEFQPVNRTISKLSQIEAN